MQKMAASCQRSGASSTGTPMATRPTTATAAESTNQRSSHRLRTAATAGSIQSGVCRSVVTLSIESTKPCPHRALRAGMRARSTADTAQAIATIAHAAVDAVHAHGSLAPGAVTRTMPDVLFTDACMNITSSRLPVREMAQAMATDIAVT